MTTLGKTETVFETPIRQVLRLDRDELNRWLMDQTGSVSYVPEIGVILLMPHDWNVITRFDLVANGIVPGDLAGALASEQIHVQQAEYAPEMVYLARIDRSRLISGWDIPGSLARVSSAQRVGCMPMRRSKGRQPRDTGHDEGHHGGEEEAAEDPHPEKFGGISYVVDSTTEVLLDRMDGIARLVGVVVAARRAAAAVDGVGARRQPRRAADAERAAHARPDAAARHLRRRDGPRARSAAWPPAASSAACSASSAGSVVTLLDLRAWRVCRSTC